MAANAACAGSSSGNSVFQTWLQAWKDWQVTILMIVTMSLQLWLVLVGFVRKYTSNALLHSTVWLAFIGLDAIAAYAMGLMLGSGCDTVFALWAPIVLFHLGAADNISAFSPADNELWKRHGFKMTLEIVGAGYILSRSGSCGRFLASGVMLFMVGAFKYCERVYALWGGSTAQVVKSARPIYKFMAMDHHRVVPQDDGSTSTNPLIVSGEGAWYQRSLSGRGSATVRNSTSVVTYEDVVKCRDLKRASHSINDICLAYALFKIYRRRLTNLRIHHKDDDYDKVRKVFFPVGEPRAPLKVIKVIDLELSFIFDGVFTKGAAGKSYQGIGVTTRLLSLLLLFMATMILLAAGAGDIVCDGGSSSTTTVHMAGGLTILLVTIALLLEALQVYKIIRSNGTRVWLACAYLTEQRAAASTIDHHYRHRFHQFNTRALLRALRYAGNPKSSHWRQRIGQRSIVADAIKSAAWRYFVEHFQIDEAMLLREQQVSILNMVEVDASNVHYYLVEKLADKFEDVTFHNLAHRREQIARSMSFPFDGHGMAFLRGPEFSPANDSGLEEAVLFWHVATSVCEMDLMKLSPHEGESPRQQESVKASIALSRYCMYLLISRTKLTPGDPDHFHPLYSRSREEMTRLVLLHPHTIESTLLKDHKIADPAAASTSSSSSSSSAHIDPGIKLGRALMENFSLEERWNKLAQVWVDILVYIAISENAHPHTEQLARGGELLTHVWVLLGHLGFGQKSWITKPHGQE